MSENKYYIGKTQKPDYRLADHFKGKGSQWTKIYKPLEVVELIPDCDDYDEDKYVRIYMDKYGIDNVRGGSFSKIKLSQATRKQLETMSRGTSDKCFKCGEGGHFSRGCRGGSKAYNNDKKDIKITEKKEEKKIYDNFMTDVFGFVKEVMVEELRPRKRIKKYFKGNVTCYRCGRKGHYATRCKNKTHKDGHKI